MIANVQPECFGFLTIVSIADVGHIGGLLVVSPEGRPIEFHCTAPVRENKTQKILYGQTYQGFLFCDQIAKSLVDKAKTKPDIVVTDRSELLGINKLTESPVVCLQSEASTAAAAASGAEPIAGSADSGNRNHFMVNDETVTAEVEDQDRLLWMEQACQRFGDSLPLIEPFERIRLAIDEAQSVAR